jgi:hypothetical protein
MRNSFQSVRAEKEKSLLRNFNAVGAIKEALMVHHKHR